MTGMPDAAEVERRLAEVRAKRGYLLPHHGLLAIAAPGLLKGYDAAYTALALTPRLMHERPKEFVWLAVLTACDEAIATHHIAKFRAAGGTDAEIELAIRLAAFAEGAPRFAFAAEKWGHHLPAYDRARAYRAALDALQAGSGVPRGLVEVTLAAVHTTRKGWWELALHIRGAYDEGVPELELAEGISYAMFPGSIPNFVDACGVWQGMVARGEVAASEAFRIWGADAANQAGFG
ncbi:carboxymuconolactone decarboxylase family protein [Sediminicoccus sp. KRV36]|uniref:carboxymuconolactone decarboxylase family protein n=1 Tax=Sediminicoccus sp. KRV36 TaxID=3133721 RepID=UPI00200FB62A|nr:carboxymuconolactone decarboxylase family protein [Sediminicoccus rosea]UPY36282.1 carboxymuconolactone decarboxylase family protein [Sediminicoccus rosea]